MSTARLQALEDCLRKRADRLLEINQQQQRRLETKLHRLHVQSMETIFAHERSKEMFEKQYSYLYDIVERSHSRKEDDGISKDLFLPQMKSMTRYPWQNNTDRTPRYMAVVRTNNIVYFSGQKTTTEKVWTACETTTEAKIKIFSCLILVTTRRKL